MVPRRLSALCLSPGVAEGAGWVEAGQSNLLDKEGEMASKQLMATLAGGVTAGVLGYVFYGLLLTDFYEGNLGSATGVYRDVPIFWAFGAGQLLWAGFLTMVMGWRGDASAGAGFKTGGIVGLIMGASINLTMYGTANIANLTASLVDPIVAMIGTAIVGAVIGVVLGMGGGSAAPAAASAPPPPPPPPPPPDEHTGGDAAGF